MTNTDDRAFPSFEFNVAVRQMLAKGGLTKREYFAAMAMSGIAMWDAAANKPGYAGYPDILANSCVEYADALIAELNKEVKP